MTNFRVNAMRTLALLAVGGTLALGTVLADPGHAQPNGNALAFRSNNNDFLRLPTDPSLDSNEFTIQLWVRREAKIRNQHCVIGRSANGLDQSNGIVLTYGYLEIDAWTVFIDGNPFSGTQPQPLGQWAHLSVVYDGNEVVLYFNGCEEARGFYPQVMNWDSDIYFGVEQDCIDGCFDAKQALGGLLDDIRIWSVPRTVEQIQCDMRTDIPPVDPENLVAHFTLDESGGPLAIDSSGFENHALVGIPRDFGAHNHKLAPSRVTINIAGNVDAARDGPTNVLFINGSPGNLGRAMTLSSKDPVLVSLLPATHGPVPGPFAMYTYFRGTTSPAESPMGLGWTTFPTAFHGSEDDNMRTFVNNLGGEQFGEGNLRRGPAPTSVIIRNRSPHSPLSVSIQCYIRDNGSLSPRKISVTNSIDLRIVP